METTETDAGQKKLVADWAGSGGCYDPESSRADNWLHRNRQEAEVKRLAHGLGWLSLPVSMAGMMIRFLSARSSTRR